MQKTIKEIAIASKVPVINKGQDLLDLIEIHSEVPIYIRIPVKNLIAPIHISFSYFNNEKRVIDPKLVDTVLYISYTHHHPEIELQR